ncbi:PEP-CTERM sorting domain-containing protein [Paludibacterium paludis]|uniref:Ice-binding protein C-terminal domain-containing protein n=1 Tax=Paludibacterium paludis TaxID=1225769 RepID=A0A918U9E2_9NEIS|nr:PEP-CTERM sorting domain-containing protein [Paludibacterium paludis]GGY13360.1 hypothetical protein GCM10011289_15820 [Paludibacterium paludis]
MIAILAAFSACRAAAAVIDTPVYANGQWQSYRLPNQHVSLDRDGRYAVRFALTPDTARQASFTFLTHGLWNVNDRRWETLTVEDAPSGNAYEKTFSVQLGKGDYDFGLDMYSTGTWSGTYRFSIDAAPAVPEPESVALMGMGLAALALRWRKRR